MNSEKNFVDYLLNSLSRVSCCPLTTHLVIIVNKLHFTNNIEMFVDYRINDSEVMLVDYPLNESINSEVMFVDYSRKDTQDTLLH